MNILILYLKRLTALSFIILLFCPPYLYAATAESLNRIKDNAISFKSINSLEICHGEVKQCVSEFNALMDLFPKQNIGIIGNYGLVKEKSLIHVVYSAKVNDGKDYYAIFFTQTNEIQGAQGLGTCNACGAKLGVVIYQFHNKWKLFGSESNIEETGANGKIQIEDRSFSFYPQGPERFMLTYDDYGQAQGFEVTSRHLILVNSSALSNISTSGKADIKYFGFFPVKESSCNATEDGEFWIGSVSFEKNSLFVPSVRMQKTTSSCQTKKVVRRESVFLSKAGSEKKLVPHRSP